MNEVITIMANGGSVTFRLSDVANYSVTPHEEQDLYQFCINFYADSNTDQFIINVTEEKMKQLSKELGKMSKKEHIVIHSVTGNSHLVKFSSIIGISKQKLKEDGYCDVVIQLEQGVSLDAKLTEENADLLMKEVLN